MAGNIHAGDLKIWSGNGLVLFYKNFKSPYSYYDLGTIEHAEGLQEVVGKGTVDVTLSLISDGITAVTGEMPTQSVSTIYSLDGRLVTEAEAKNGIFIVNGKKMIR